MGTLTVLHDPFDPAAKSEYRHTGPLLDWLLTHYPDGFAGDHVTLYNLERLAVADYDRSLGADDRVTIACFPADPGTAALGAVSFFKLFAATWYGQAIVAAVVGLAVNYALGALFGPKSSTPSRPAYAATGGLPSADTVYSFSGSANTARIGQTIPVAYGRNRLAPDLAMAPYVYFEGNQQYLIHLECLGQGTFTLHDAKIAGSDVAALGEAVISVLHYPPSAHGQTFGTIQNQTGRFENVYTSPSVSDQELYGPSGANGLATTAHLGTWFWNKWTYPWMDFAVPVQEYADAFQGGRAVYLHVLDGVNAGVWRIGFIFHSASAMGNTPQLRFIRGHLLLEGPWWRGDQGGASVIVSYSPEVTDAPAGGLLGPFLAVPTGHATTALQYDLVFPSGCYRVSGNALAAFEVAVRFVATPIDDEGQVIGADLIHDYAETMATNTPQRRTLHHTVPSGRYRVSAQRRSLQSGIASDQSKCHWTGLKAVLGHPTGGPVYGDVTLLSVKIKATEGLSGNAHQALSVDCTRDGLTTPTAAFQDILTNSVYGARRPLSEVDTDTLAALAADWSGQTFDAVFDQPTTVWDALKLSVQMRSAVPIAHGAMVSLVADRARASANALLTDRQIKSLVMAYRFSELADRDGVEGEYKNADDNAAEFVTEPYDAVNPERIVLWGCKDNASATAFVQRYWKQLRHRRRTLTIELEGDGHALQIGDVVDVTYPLLNLAGLRCVVASIKPTDEFSTTVEATVYQPEVFA